MLAKFEKFRDNKLQKRAISSESVQKTIYELIKRLS